MRSRLFAVAALLLFACVGCGGGSTATAAGKVTFQGKPLTGGSVNLVASDGTVFSGPIGADGSFSIPLVPAGTVKIGVTGPAGAANPNKPLARRGGEAGGASGGRGPAPTAPATPEPAPSGPTIPATYGDPAASGLTGTVAAGKPLDIDLK